MKSRTSMASCQGPGVKVRQAWPWGTSSIPGVLGLNFGEIGVVVIFALPVGLYTHFLLYFEVMGPGRSDRGTLVPRGGYGRVTSPTLARENVESALIRATTEWAISEPSSPVAVTISARG